MQRDQEIFRQSVSLYATKHSIVLALGFPRFREDGNLVVARFETKDGTAEFLYGPPEYHVEIVLRPAIGARKWEYADLLALPAVAAWAQGRSMASSVDNGVGSEVAHFFDLIVNALKGVPDFRWVFSSNT